MVSFLLEFWVVKMTELENQSYSWVCTEEKDIRQKKRQRSEKKNPPGPWRPSDAITHEWKQAPDSLQEMIYQSKLLTLGCRLARSVARDPCAEALQRTRVRLLARVPLMHVTPPLLPCFLSHSSAVSKHKLDKRFLQNKWKHALKSQFTCNNSAV